jgi:hypothetical protein
LNEKIIELWDSSSEKLNAELKELDKEIGKVKDSK